MTTNSDKDLGIVRLSDLPRPEPMDDSDALSDEELTWERIDAEEPEVGRILSELGTGRKGSYGRWRRYVSAHGTSPKADLARLVGWRARNPKLRSEKAYRLTMERMWELVL